MSSVEEKTTFSWLNATQFFGALNDNLFKLVIIFFLIASLGREHTDNITATAGLFFVLPFLLFSHAAGVLADRMSKRNIIVLVKLFEVFVMALGVLALASGSPFFLYVVVFLMSLQSTFFGPSKFGIVPELVRRESLSRVNSLLVSFSFLAIIIGTSAAPFVSSAVAPDYTLAGAVCVVIAAVGFLCSLGIKKTLPARSKNKFSLFFIKDIWATLRFIYRNDKYLFLTVIGSAYFLLIGAYLQLNLIGYGINVLNMTKENSTFLFLIAACGIGLGSYLSGRLSGRNIEFGIVPIGAAGITLSSIIMSQMTSHHLFLVFVMIFALGISAGLFIVPLQAFIQYRSPDKKRGEILAVSNFLSFCGVLIASLFIYLFS
ncbi:MAG: MFS transporter, partial [Candidatus Aureabacteria bacterium]|nr:MFS transporter [Candidatus Auribacterota bacterium]